MKILVIGGSGFIGRNVSDSLTKYGHKVTILDKKKIRKLKKIKSLFWEILEM